LLAFVGVAVLVLVVIAVATVVVARRVAQHEALRDAERTTTRLANFVVAPLIGGILSGKAGTRAELDRAVQARIADGLVTEIDIWRPDGTVVYANERQAFPTVAGTAGRDPARRGRLRRQQGRRDR
jgi:hypothetical protein